MIPHAAVRSAIYRRTTVFTCLLHPSEMPRGRFGRSRSRANPSLFGYGPESTGMCRVPDAASGLKVACRAVAAPPTARTTASSTVSPTAPTTAASTVPSAVSLHSGTGLTLMRHRLTGTDFPARMRAAAVGGPRSPRRSSAPRAKNWGSGGRIVPQSPDFQPSRARAGFGGIADGHGDGDFPSGGRRMGGGTVSRPAAEQIFGTAESAVIPRHPPVRG